MSTLILCMYALIAGLWIGEWRAEKRAKRAVACHDAMRLAARKVLDARRFVGDGLVVTNKSQWKMGKERFLVSIEPLDGTNQQP